MYLKKLELVGFKSFADKTEFIYPKSVTAIVGPNGCGKSNVVDAFKWIFGEQSAKGLRGEEMKDVIFNGTQSRKPTGFAEVTIVFDNTDRALDIDYTEVAITRRLYRSGESEYLINKQKCRLRDIKELLLDTGLGTSSYSMLEQGKIDVLLQASTLDRRIIFEEAAGISKYRVKKAETLRALERTSENLARLGDIIDEVEKRMHRLKVQAGKARRYREHSERLKTLRVRAALEDYRTSIDERGELTARRFFMDYQLSRREDVLSRLRQGLDRQRADREAAQSRLFAVREELADARTRRERMDERIAQDVRRLSELVEERDRKEAERAAEIETNARHLKDLEREGAALEAAGAEIAGLREAVAGKARELEARRAVLVALGQEIERRREGLVAALQERSRVGNRLAQLSSELAGLTGRRQRTSTALESSRTESQALAEREDSLKSELAAGRTELDGLDRARGELEARLTERRAALSGVESRLAELSGGLQDRRARLEVLRRIEESREGLGKGTAALLKSGTGSARILGLVADFIRVERRYAAAVEAVLGEHAQALVVETQEGGLALLRQAQEEAGGGAEVIALDRLGAPASFELEAAYPGFPAEAGVLGPLADRVEAAEEHRELVERLLEGVILVADLSTAVALSRNGLRPYRLVAVDGSRVEPWGAMAAAGPGAWAGIISRRSEMAELEAELGGLAAEFEQVRGEREAAVGVLEAIEEERRRLGQSREALALRCGNTATLLGQVERERGQSLREVKVGESELAEIARLEEELRAQETVAAGQARALDLRRETEEAELSGREKELSGTGEACRVLGEAVTEVRVKLAEAEEREEGLRRALAQLVESRREHERRERALAGQLEEIERRQEETAADLEASRAAASGIREAEAVLQESVERLEVEERELAGIEAAFGTEIEKVRSQVESGRHERESVNFREQEGKLRRNALVEKIADEYGLDLGAVASEAHAPVATSAAITTEATEAVISEGAVPGEGVCAEATNGAAVAVPQSAPEEPWDRAAAEVEMQALKEKLRHLGNVNLEALDELDELEERHRFMTGQRDDLRKAESDLREIIAEINRTSRELFLKTFETVQKHFAELFRKCFGGGMAELVLEEGADVLEAGIEIIARPPGKKLTSLSLMSGGEKTMTTIALLFAIFRSRPSPFCILDEVDAPLDENNVRRFVVLLQDFVQSTQFIIITHNKITMAEADCLFGITMEERGVSKRVAVEFESYDQAVTVGAPDDGERAGGRLAGLSGAIDAGVIDSVGAGNGGEPPASSQQAALEADA